MILKKWAIWLFTSHKKALCDNPTILAQPFTWYLPFLWDLNLNSWIWISEMNKSVQFMNESFNVYELDQLLNLLKKRIICTLLLFSWMCQGGQTLRFFVSNKRVCRTKSCHMASEDLDNSVTFMSFFQLESSHSCNNLMAGVIKNVSHV